MEGLSINNIVTNEDIVITYTPSVTYYSYVIIKDNVYGNPVYINNGMPSEIKLTEEGTYRVEVTIGGITSSSGEYVIDKTSPVININEKTYTITNKEVFDINNKVVASDSRDGDLRNSLTTNYDELDFSVPGIKKLEYTATDEAGNTATETIYVTVKKDNSDLILVGQVSIIFLVLVVILFLIKYLRSIMLEKRFSKYTLNSSKNASISLFDNLCNQYDDYINKMSKHLSSLNIVTKMSERYRKYITAFNLDSNPIKIIANKIVLGVVFILGYLVINIFRSKVAQPFEIILPFVLGFYTLDIIYIYKYRMYK